MSRLYYCNICNKDFNNRNNHRCTVWCNICGRNGCILNKDDNIQCTDCNAPCPSISCLNEHQMRKNGNKSLCERMLFCPYCKVKLHNYKKMELIWINIHVEKVFVKIAKSCIIMMKKKTFINVS